MEVEGRMIKEYDWNILFIVELEEGVWLTNGEGDPPRTLVKENAVGFFNKQDAIKALEEAKTIRPFKNAKII